MGDLLFSSVTYIFCLVDSLFDVLVFFRFVFDFGLPPVTHLSPAGFVKLPALTATNVARKYPSRVS